MRRPWVGSQSWGRPRASRSSCARRHDLACATAKAVRRSYLEITSESGLKGYAGPLLKEQAAAFPANLRELLAGRDAADPEKLNFATLWAACHPGKHSKATPRGKTR